MQSQLPFGFLMLQAAIILVGILQLFVLRKPTVDYIHIFCIAIRDYAFVYGGLFVVSLT